MSVAVSQCMLPKCQLTLSLEAQTQDMHTLTTCYICLPDSKAAMVRLKRVTHFVQN